MSSKLVRKKKNKPKYGWMQSEIDAAVCRDAYDKHVAGYAVTMMQHVLEIGLWTLHDKFGFGRKRLERVQGIFNEYLKEHYEKKLDVHEFPILVQAKAGADVEAEAKKFSQKCRMNLAKMEYPKNPRNLKVKLITTVDLTAEENVVTLNNFSHTYWHCKDCDIDFGTEDLSNAVEEF